MAEPFDPETVREAPVPVRSAYQLAVDGLKSRDRVRAESNPRRYYENALIADNGEKGSAQHTTRGDEFGWDDLSALVLDHANLLASHDAHVGEVEALREIVATLEQHVGERDARLHEVRDFLEDQFDVEDGDEGDVLPNWAMRAVNIIDQPWAAFQAERRTP